ADLSVGVLTGAGGTFCAGMDLKAFLRGEAPIVEGRGFGGLVEAPPRKPLMAAVEGFAGAGGTETALSGDMIVQAAGGRSVLPEVKRGLVALGGGLLRLPRRIPAGIAMELALTGEDLGAERAHGLGLVNHLAEDGGALAAALELAEKIAANGPLAVAATKQIVAPAGEWSAGEAFAKQLEIAGPVFASEAAQEGPRAFAEKRAPVWKGRGRGGWATAGGPGAIRHRPRRSSDRSAIRSAPHLGDVGELARRRCGCTGRGAGEPRRRHRLGDPVQIRQDAAGRHMRMLRRLGEGQDRRGARVLVREDLGPLVAGAGGEPIGQRLAQLGPGVPIVLAGQRGRIQAEPVEQLRPELRLDRADREVAAVGTGVGVVVGD